MTRAHLAAMDGSIHLRVTGLKVGCLPLQLGVTAVWPRAAAAHTPDLLPAGLNVD
jgi:hypothetical protein